MILTRRPTLVLMAVAAFLFALHSHALAKEAVVTTKDGRQFTGGVLSDDSAGVSLKISGIQTLIARASIEKVEYRKSIDEQYQERRATIPDNNLEDRYKLASWLFEEKAYPLAKRELDDLLKRFPDDQRVTLLSRVVDQKIKLMNESSGKDVMTTTRPATPTHGDAVKIPANPANPKGGPERLTEEQLNLIKVYDINLDDRPNVNVPRDVLETLFKNHATDPAVPTLPEKQQALRLSPGWAQLQVIVNARARELYSKVKVVDDPRNIQIFKTSIHRNYVLNYCGTSNCHGGDKSGDFFVFRAQADSDKTAYTNYLLVYQFKGKQGAMVDLTDPESSLLLQYGLARTSAKIPHPDAAGWKPKFNRPDDPAFLAMVEWVRSLGAFRKTYPFSYTVKGHGATTQPSEEAGK